MSWLMWEDESQEDRVRRRQHEQHAEESADSALVELPLAGSTRQCPKCLFDRLTYRYVLCDYRAGFWARHYESFTGMFHAPSRMLIVRNCPQCGADVFERPADSQEAP